MAHITRAVRGDLPDLIRLLGLLYAQEAEYTPDVRKQEQGLSLLLTSPESAVIFVARDRGKAVGMVTLTFTVSTAEGGHMCWLQDMIISPAAQGGGLGSELLKHAIEYARQRGIRSISLLTDGDNAGAIRFYERHGFAPSEMRPLRLQVDQLVPPPPPVEPVQPVEYQFALNPPAEAVTGPAAVEAPSVMAVETVEVSPPAGQPASTAPNMAPSYTPPAFIQGS